LIQLAMAAGAALLIDMRAGEQVGLVRRERRLVLRAFADRRFNGFARNGSFHWQRTAFGPHKDSAASKEKIFSQEKQTDSHNKTEKEFDHGFFISLVAEAASHFTCSLSRQWSRVTASSSAGPLDPLTSDF
jgi:hypothetical protein